MPTDTPADASRSALSTSSRRRAAQPVRPSWRTINWGLLGAVLFSVGFWSAVVFAGWRATHPH